MKKIFFILSLLLLLLHSSSVSADKLIDTPASEIYVFHLWYDNGALRKDSAFDFSFDQEIGTYEESQSTSSSAISYSGKIVSTKGNVLNVFNFYLDALGQTGKGALSVKAPHFSNAKTAIFYDPQNKEILTIDLAPSGPLCNEDKICNDNFGENNQNCPTDCPRVAPELVTDNTPENTPAVIPTDKQSESSNLTVIILISSFLIITIGGWLFIRKRRAQ